LANIREIIGVWFLAKVRGKLGLFSPLSVSPFFFNITSYNNHYVVKINRIKRGGGILAKVGLGREFGRWGLERMIF
jgi:hypothetical protein